MATRTSIVLFVALYIMAMTSPASAAIMVFQAGAIDGFSLPADPATPSAEIAAFTAMQDFDLISDVNGGSINTNTIHTFVGLPTGIVGGTLEIPVEAGDPFGTGGVDTDGVALLFIDALSASLIDGLVFSRTFGLFPGGGLFSADAGLLTPGVPWSTGDSGTILFDLTALPLAGGGTLDITPQLNTNGFLDVLVGDETGADYFLLTLDVSPVPIPAALPLFMSAIAGLGFVGSRRKQSA